MTEQVYGIRDQYINGSGRLFGGVLVAWIDELASIVARRHARKDVTTVTIDQVNFKAPAYEGDMVVLRGKLTYTGHTSMEIKVDTYREALTGKRDLINTAYLVLVALDEEEKPVVVPQLIIESEEEKREWAAGEKRYKLRQKRRVEGY